MNLLSWFYHLILFNSWYLILNAKSRYSIWVVLNLKINLLFLNYQLRPPPHTREELN